MTNLKARIGVSLATVALLTSVLAPATFAASSNTIKNNGSKSHSKIKVTNSSKTTVKQSNTAVIANLTGVFQNTGGNKANGNTGDGDVTNSSGNATATVTNTNTAGGNVANVDPCGCVPADTDNQISDNGSKSHNKITVNSSSSSTTTQTNTAVIVNGTLVAQNTGDNHANNNTGDGSVDVSSGDADATVENTTTTGLNVLNP